MTKKGLVLSVQEIPKAIREARKKVPEWKVQFSAGLITVANMAVGSLLFGQFLQVQQFNFQIAGLSILICVVFYIISLRSLRE